MEQHVHYVLLLWLAALNVILRILAFFAQTKGLQMDFGEPRIYKHVNMNVKLLLVLLAQLVVSNVLQMSQKIIV